MRKIFRHSKILFAVLCGLFLILPQKILAQEENFPNEKEIQTQTTDSPEAAQSKETLRHFLAWPFVHLLQPIFSAIVYPISEPLLYAFRNGATEKALALVTFGEEKNIFIYPTMNLKPGTQTMLGFTYRHANLLFDSDYFVLSGNFYANSDIYYSARYSKRYLFDGETYLALSHNAHFNRDNSFRLLGTCDTYTMPDTTYSLDLSLSHPILFPDVSLSVSSGVRFRFTDLPEMKSEFLEDSLFFEMKERGIYQDFRVFPQKLSLSYNNTESPFVPTNGIRFSIEGGYYFVDGYYDAPKEFEDKLSSEKNHDYFSLELLFQKYFYLTKLSKPYQYTMKEARERRREYVDFARGKFQTFSPARISSWLAERRVVAFQARYIRYYEVEEGGMPILAYPQLNARFPLRGFDQAWIAPAVAGVSAEYRWPIDYYIDGVAFLEYGIFTDKKGHWDLDNLRNSWGFGVRVRRPEIYFFRLQLGFHGLHGIQLVLTIIPEFR